MGRCLVFALLLLIACSDSDDPGSTTGPTGADTTAPSAITDLQVLSYDVGQATISWTAPGDDGSSGAASEYRVGFSAGPITDANWDACTALFAPPVPAGAGTAQTAQIAPPPFPDVYVAIKAVDDAGNWSPLSNVAYGHRSGAYEVVQLTFDANNRYPCLSDGFVTWVGWTEHGDEIFIGNVHGAVPSRTRLTDNGGQKRHPSSHGSEKIVWQGRDADGDDWEIFVYSHGATPRYRAHTDNDVHDMFPSLGAAGNFAWQQGPTLHEEILYWNEGLHDQVRLSNDCCPTDEYSNTMPVADGFTVVFESWHRTGTGDRAATYLWDGTLHDITDDVDGKFSRRYSLDGGTIAYEWGGSPVEIRYWDGTTVHDVAVGYNPSLDGGWIAYEVWDGHDWEIHLWDGTNFVEITDNDYDDSDASLSGDRLAWNGRPTGSGGLYQIFFAKLPRELRQPGHP